MVEGLIIIGLFFFFLLYFFFLPVSFFVVWLIVWFALVETKTLLTSTPLLAFPAT